MKKPRKDSKLDNLPESRVMELRDKLLANEGYEDIVQWLAVECGCPVSISALTPFYRRHCAPLIRDKRQLSAVKAEVLVDDAGRTDWNAATMELVKQTSFEILNGEKLDPKTAISFLKIVLKADAQETDKSKAKETAKSKEEAGIDALAENAKGNKEAEAALKAYVAAMRKAKP